ncbi:MAG: two-component regulator propeller domain-containing protein [Chitinophagaceae bacterium]
MRFFYFLLLIVSGVSAQNTLPGIGAWREHLPYQSAIDVTASATKIYCATPYSLFSVDVATNEVERMSKVSGLSETGISTIKYDAAGNKLFIAYTNSNIDVIDAKGIKNIPELKRENIAGDKSIYHIYPANNLAYLSTGVGIIVVDAIKYEIADSWLIGSGGSYVKTNMFTQDNSFFYAATDEGLKKTAVTNTNPADFRTWQMISGTNGLSASACKAVVNLQNKIVALQNDTLFVQNGNAWNIFYADGWPVISINESENKLLICQRINTGESRVVVLNADGSVLKILQQPNVISFPKKGITHNGDYWIADLYGGLSHWFSNTLEQYKLNSPEGIATGEVAFYNNTFYAAAGSVNDAWNYQYNGNGIYQLRDGNWSNINRFTYSKLDTLLDFITVAIDPRDATIWGGSFGGGLLHIKENNQFEIYKQNSPIRATVGDPSSYRVSGLAFDAENNLWISNYGAAQQLHVLKNNNTWKSFSIPFSLFENAVSQIIVDDVNQKWIVSPKADGLIVFNHGNSIDDVSDDKWRLYTTGRGNGNLPSSEIYTIAKDKNGFIWIGTGDGIAVIQCPQQVFTMGCEATLPVAQQGNFANYLFKAEEVRSIAVDGANRKWIGTRNGVWLISPDGDKVLKHFTESNSPLLSDDIKSIAVNGLNGEVFFATASGIISFRSTATDPSVSNKNLLVFPNPVPPGYSGTIAIKGLAENSYVKITELNGRLVYQAKALGGQAVWNGMDYTGRKIASGVYLVLVTDESRQEKAVGKIVFIGR